MLCSDYSRMCRKYSAKNFNWVDNKISIGFYSDFTEL
jgi:hypothetical protein